MKKTEGNYFAVWIKDIIEEPMTNYELKDPWNSPHIRHRIHKLGLPKRAFRKIKEDFDITHKTFKESFHVHLRTIDDRKERRITGPPTFAAIDWMTVWDEGLAYFKDKHKWLRWLKTPNPFFDDLAPIRLLSDPGGVEMVRQKIAQLAHGIAA